ncbi:MAG: hypothetical protein LBD23_09540 [Oscillospiraceae bacterium]|jgi:hypothetical protein|nr:hypothetical protein [Oscillospiraceae bacterium]
MNNAKFKNFLKSKLGITLISLFSFSIVCVGLYVTINYNSSTVKNEGVGNKTLIADIINVNYNNEPVLIYDVNEESLNFPLIDEFEKVFCQENATKPQEIYDDVQVINLPDDDIIQIAVGDYNRQCAEGDNITQEIVGDVNEQIAIGDDISQYIDGDENEQIAIGEDIIQSVAGVGNQQSASGRSGNQVVAGNNNQQSSHFG